MKIEYFIKFRDTLYSNKPGECWKCLLIEMRRSLRFEKPYIVDDLWKEVASYWNKTEGQTKGRVREDFVRSARLSAAGAPISYKIDKLVISQYDIPSYMKLNFTGLKKLYVTTKYEACTFNLIESLESVQDALQSTNILKVAGENVEKGVMVNKWKLFLTKLSPNLVFLSLGYKVPVTWSLLTNLVQLQIRDASMEEDFSLDLPSLEILKIADCNFGSRHKFPKLKEYMTSYVSIGQEDFFLVTPPSFVITEFDINCYYTTYRASCTSITNFIQGKHFEFVSLSRESIEFFETYFLNGVRQPSRRRIRNQVDTYAEYFEYTGISFDHDIVDFLNRLKKKPKAIIFTKYYDVEEFTEMKINFINDLEIICQRFPEIKFYGRIVINDEDRYYDEDELIWEYYGVFSGKCTKLTEEQKGKELDFFLNIPRFSNFLFV